MSDVKTLGSLSAVLRSKIEEMQDNDQEEIKPVLFIGTEKGKEFLTIGKMEEEDDVKRNVIVYGNKLKSKEKKALESWCFIKGFKFASTEEEAIL